MGDRGLCEDRASKPRTILKIEMSGLVVGFVEISSLPVRHYQNLILRRHTPFRAILAHKVR